MPFSAPPFDAASKPEKLQKIGFRCRIKTRENNKIIGIKMA
jgi:ribosomal protein L34